MSISTADFNGDGNIDIATANAYGNDVSVLLGLGDGSFLPQFAITVGAEPNSIIALDFNGDAVIDLATANRGGDNVSILLGTGDGSFANATNFETGFSPHAVTSGDFNADGFADLATANRNSDNVSVLLGNSDGSFGLKTDFATTASPWSIDAGDVNRDGITDLVAGSPGRVSVLLGIGDGTFVDHSEFDSGTDSVLILDDINGDDSLDIVTAGEAVSVLTGLGDGSFLLPEIYGIGGISTSVVTEEFNGDGFRDLAAGVTQYYCSSDDQVAVLLGKQDGAGTFATTKFSFFDVPFGYAVNLLTPGDFNGDGIVDLAGIERLFSSRNYLHIMIGNGDGTWMEPEIYPVEYTVAAATGDLNGDGFVDLATRSVGGVNVLLGNGDGTFAVPDNYPAGGGFNRQSIMIADFNQDGVSDLATPRWVLLGSGDGEFSSAQMHGGFGTVTGDFDGDGIQDLAGANGNSLSISLGLGNGFFSLLPDLEQVGDGPYSIASGDLNGDGLSDLISANRYSSNISVLLAVGDGDFAEQVIYPTGDGCSFVATGDVNSDGKMDIVSSNWFFQLLPFYRGDVSVLLGNGDGTFSDAINYFSHYPMSVVTGDFNSDGRTDIATGSFGVAALLNQGFCEFVLGDVNLDGEVNLLDVSPFVTLIVSGEYQVEADINQDEAVNLLDIAPFVDLLSGP